MTSCAGQHSTSITSHTYPDPTSAQHDAQRHDASETGTNAPSASSSTTPPLLINVPGSDMAWRKPESGGASQPSRHGSTRLCAVAGANDECNTHRTRARMLHT